MSSFEKLLESGKKLEKLNQEGKTTKADIIEALNILIEWCESDDIPSERLRR